MKRILYGFMVFCAVLAPVCDVFGQSYNIYLDSLTNTYAMNVSDSITRKVGIRHDSMRLRVYVRQLEYALESYVPADSTRGIRYGYWVPVAVSGDNQPIPFIEPETDAVWADVKQLFFVGMAGLLGVSPK